ncbi:uncharacterized protein LOC131939800 [Physella acuta]|uniref:uncharacterized protein LOC131939800 n=1 Tax=Physella acuta TaxID=109671 RepID=UPI0027DCDE1C|nr:uncharacterized protein LOC131939800 [Physella acuta]
MLPLILAFVFVGSSLAVERDIYIPPIISLNQLLRRADVQDFECTVSGRSVTISCSTKRDGDQQSINIGGFTIPIISPILLKRETQDEFTIFGVPISGTINVTVGKRIYICPTTYTGTVLSPVCFRK